MHRAPRCARKMTWRPGCRCASASCAAVNARARASTRARRAASGRCGASSRSSATRSSVTAATSAGVAGRTATEASAAWARGGPGRARVRECVTRRVDAPARDISRVFPRFVVSSARVTGGGSSGAQAAAEEILIRTAARLRRSAAVLAAVRARELATCDERLERQLARGRRRRGVVHGRETHVVHE